VNKNGNFLSEMNLFYWKIPGRASLAYVLLKAGGKDVTFFDEDEAAEKQTYKKIAPFAQLPYLVDNASGVTIT
jgi:hypothetical protein